MDNVFAQEQSMETEFGMWGGSDYRKNPENIVPTPSHVKTNLDSGNFVWASNYARTEHIEIFSSCFYKIPVAYRMELKKKSYDRFSMISQRPPFFTIICFPGLKVS